jgi:putative methionine-R-sulfoxide reductase with GAF domain
MTRPTPAPASSTPRPALYTRDYTPLLDRLDGRGGADDVMRRVVDALWERFSVQGVSWVGFYVPDPADASRLVLSARRDKPACSPIGMHGVCGRGFVSRRPVVVRDVAVMGPNYIACDPRDKSEVVVPMINPDGSCAGVLDVDSYDIGAFDSGDALCLARLLRHVGLSMHRDESAEWVEVL